MSPDPKTAMHVEHHGNHIGYACGQPGPHCWADNEPWPCSTVEPIVLDNGGIDWETRTLTGRFGGALGHFYRSRPKSEV